MLPQTVGNQNDSIRAAKFHIPPSESSERSGVQAQVKIFTNMPDMPRAKFFRQGQPDVDDTRVTVDNADVSASKKSGHILDTLVVDPGVRHKVRKKTQCPFQDSPFVCQA